MAALAAVGVLLLAGCGGNIEALSPALVEESTPALAVSEDAPTTAAWSGLPSEKLMELPSESLSPVEELLVRKNEELAAEKTPTAIDEFLASIDERGDEELATLTRWRCWYQPTFNGDWHDDVVCGNGADEHRPYLREWDNYITQDEIMESAREYEWQLNGG